MKKALTIILLLFTFFICYFLQIDFFSWFTIAGVMPNMFIILALFVGLFAGRTTGTLMGAIFGLFLDLFVGRSIGPTAILLALVGFLGGYFDRNFSKDSKLTIILMVLGTSIIYEILSYAINIYSFNLDTEIIPFLKILVVELFYQFLLTIILYPLIRRAGYKTEEIFKGNNIMTRYF